MGWQIGIMGGTFDPVHNGHLAIAASVAEQLQLDQVLFIPTGNPNFKQDMHLTSAKQRAHMVELAIAGNPLFKLDTCEIDRPGVTYTADTLEVLKERLPDANLYFIMGTDTAATLVHWKRAQDVARLCTIVVAHRPGQLTDQVRQAHEKSMIAFTMLYLDVPQVAVSSTEIRARVARGQSVAGMLPDTVIAYIEQTGLYR